MATKTKPKAKRKNKPGAGRPEVITADVLIKLIAAFHNGFNDVEACSYAGISTFPYYERMKKNKKFNETITEAKLHPNKLAKQTVLDAIKNGNAKSAQWWLDRKAKDEFSTRSEHDNNNTGVIGVLMTTAEEAVGVDSLLSNLMKYKSDAERIKSKHRLLSGEE